MDASVVVLGEVDCSEMYFAKRSFLKVGSDFMRIDVEYQLVMFRKQVETVRCGEEIALALDS